jgi:hypothetical protein
MVNGYQVFIRCRELASAHAEYKYLVIAGTFRTAVRDALMLFHQDAHVKNKRLNTLEIRVTVLLHNVPRQRVTEVELPLYPRGDK